MDSHRTYTRAIVETILTFLPWVVSMYTLYYLEYGNIWTTETPHRGKASVAILLVGMIGSFLVHSYFAAKRKRQVT